METSPQHSRSSSSTSRRSNLTLDLSNIPPMTPPTPPSNTLLFTNLTDPAIFLPENLQVIRDLITHSAPIHAFAPLKSFRRIVVSFFDEQAAIAVRQVWDNEAVMGQQCRVYFGMPTPVDKRDEHLALPDAGKLFFISPPPSPPHGWEMRLEDAPNKLVHAEDLADALAKLHHSPGPMDESQDSPVTPPDSALPGRTRSRSSTLIYKPEDAASTMPAVIVDDMTDEPEEVSPVEQSKPILAHTARPPVELMHHA
ncbi:inhibitor of calcineurin [Fusarium subglutinans]|uniref:Inhibitor of calcineurin n=1 Tax=Gibberella subglutinans TaxID=42677 RepID=A0A8H5QC32_GIBSU|nr:inhibitor of calcineurin [Fusarium subglutinans]KAF5612552.1 inhibitor of calcineurin [Fusarium subglutinans]